MLRPPSRSTLFPYTTLFRSQGRRLAQDRLLHAARRAVLRRDVDPDLPPRKIRIRSEEHTSELQSQSNLVCRLLLEKKKRPPTPGSRPHASLLPPFVRRPPRR